MRWWHLVARSSLIHHPNNPRRRYCHELEHQADPHWEDRMCAQGLCDGMIINPVYQ
jgi:hypothetical protein